MTAAVSSREHIAATAPAARLRAPAWLRRSPRLGASVALGVYLCLSVIVYGHEVVGDPSHKVVGSAQLQSFFGRDQSAYVWFLAWGAHAVGHLQNPFLTTEVFAPHGYNLTWAASIPGPALLLAPLTALIGAVAMFNVLALVAPATAAWTAFLLCRHLTRRFSSALAGGLLFGFGTYETGQTVNHLNLALVALLPLAALLVLRRHAGLTSRRRFICALGCLLGAQLWIATEVFTTMLLFGGLAFVIALLLDGRERRREDLVLGAEAGGALLLGLLLGAPLLYYALRYPNPLSGHLVAGAGADLANFVVPTRVTWLHGHGRVGALAAKLALNLSEQLSYLGPGLLLLLVAFAVGLRRSRLARALLLFMLIVAIASLGSHLTIGGHDTGVWLPWAAGSQLPFLGYAIPARFVVYLWIAAAVAAALWLDRARARRARWALFAVVAVTLAPNVTGFTWGSLVDAPPLMTTGTLARYVPAGATVIALPFGINGNSMYWQVEADFRFRMAGGYVSLAIPAEYGRQTIVRELLGNKPRRNVLWRLCRFISMTHAGFILLRDRTSGYWPLVLGPLHIRAERVGGFAILNLAGIQNAGHACHAPPLAPPPASKRAPGPA
ncbi:MAG TPA: hypothetical protein VES65_08525 [Solirubrobacteraceae bacterium]|nr:hypothetical protein [Solirubrobacteraceae bacterium]